MSTCAPLRVVVVDQHAVWREGLRSAFARRPDLRIVGECSTAAEAPALVARLRPAVVLLDPTLRAAGRPTGLDLCRDLVGRHPEVRVLVLGPSDDDRCVVAALAAGATGYLGRDASIDELLVAVRTVAAGRRALDRRAAAAMVRAASGVRPVPAEVLTSRQLEVLRLLARGLSNRDIADALTVSEGTVKFHLAKIMRRLGVPGRAAAVYAASRQGLI
jgi:DNA-binding NarL/FixJ family response regulator